jgi:hypothetical protein
VWRGRSGASILGEVAIAIFRISLPSSAGVYRARRADLTELVCAPYSLNCEPSPQEEPLRSAAD